MTPFRFACSHAIAGLFLLGMLALPPNAGADDFEKNTAPVAAAADAPSVTANSAVEAGRYLVQVSGCNDCHTANWMETGGSVADIDWLAGTPIGWRGPWGTTYPSNLRTLVQDIDEDAWVTLLKTRTARPPMPWMNVNKLSDTDSRAIYRFIRSLGVRGDRMPAAVDPDVEPATPYFLMEPQHLERMPAPRVSQNDARPPGQ